MLETTLQVRVPTPLLRLGFDQNDVQRRLTEWLILSLFTEGHISSGKAARLMNISRIEFLALLRARGIAYVNYTPDELAEEFAAAETLEEIAEFWDTHSLADYWEQTREGEFEVKAMRRPRVTLDSDLYVRIETEARKRALLPETLVNLWLLERLQQAA